MSALSRPRISGCCWWLIRVDAAEMTPAQTFRCLRYKARLPGCRSRGTREQDRAEEGVKEDDKFGLSPTMESFGLISRGELREASYALASGARETGNPSDCTCQLWVKSHPQDNGDGHEIPRNCSLPGLLNKASSISQGQPLKEPHIWLL